MDTNNVVVQLCTRGMEAEGNGDAEGAAELFRRAWEVAGSDYEACIAAHYLARQQNTPQETLHWNQMCLERADRVGDDRVRGFYPSLHANIGRACLELGRTDEAREQFRLAAQRIVELPEGPYTDWLRYAVADGLRSVGAGRDMVAAVESLVDTFCARRDLRSLALILPAYLADLGTPEDRARLDAALRRLHAENRLSGGEQRALTEALAAGS